MRNTCKLKTRKNREMKASKFLRLAIFLTYTFKSSRIHLEGKLSRIHRMENSWVKRDRFLTHSPTMLSVSPRAQHPNTGFQS